MVSRDTVVPALLDDLSSYVKTAPFRLLLEHVVDHNLVDVAVLPLGSVMDETEYDVVKAGAVIQGEGSIERGWEILPAYFPVVFVEYVHGLRHERRDEVQSRDRDGIRNPCVDVDVISVEESERLYGQTEAVHCILLYKNSINIIASMY